MTGASPTPPLSAPRESQWALVGRQFRRHASAVWGLRVAVILALVAIYAPLLASSHPLLWREPASGLSSPWLSRLFDQISWEHGVDRFFNSLFVTLTLGLLACLTVRLVRGRSALRHRAVRRATRWYAVVALVLALLQATGLAFTTSLPFVDYRAADPTLLRQGGLRAYDWSLDHLRDAETRVGIDPEPRRRIVAAVGPDLDALPLHAPESAETAPPAARFPAAAALLRGAEAGLQWADEKSGPDAGRAAATEAQRVAREAALALQRGADLLRRGGEFEAADRAGGQPDARWALRTPIPQGYREQLDGREESFAKSFDFARGARHVLGSDEVGRDVLARIIYGTRISLTVGIVAVAIYVTIGTILGSLAGYLGGRWDFLVMRAVEIVICVPPLFLLMTIVALFDTRSIFLIMAAIGVVGWTGVARLVRGQFLRERALDYVTAARALGLPTRRIVFRHVLPNALAPVLVAATFGVASAILTESTLSFIGLGDMSVPSWGKILDDGRHHGYWHLILPPSVAIFVTVTALNLVGDGIRDALDPKLRN